MTTVKVALGRRLFYDTRISGNRTFACASCHQQAHAFTDGRAHALGSTGEAHPRSAMSLANVAYNASFGWADPSVRTLEAQIAVPMFNEHPIELGIAGHEAEIVQRFAIAGRRAVVPQRRFPPTHSRCRWPTSSARSPPSSGHWCPAILPSTAISTATTAPPSARRPSAA